jgi:exopolysaccharide biosynthesis protein
MNASGFYDPTWSGNGGIPHGTVIKDGRIIYDYADAGVGGGFIGFDQDNKLILGRMTKEQALAKGMRDGIEFGPFLIVNGKASFVKGDGGWGIAPRSAIGQRADGIVLFAVINGRNYTSGILGIDMVGMTELMLNYGAVNAANLDGGTSSALLEGQELLTNPISSTGTQGVLRRIPTAWIVTE